MLLSLISIIINVMLIEGRKILKQKLYIQGDPKKSIRVWLSISQQLFGKYKRNVLHQRIEKLT